MLLLGAVWNSAVNDAIFFTCYSTQRQCFVSLRGFPLHGQGILSFTVGQGSSSRAGFKGGILGIAFLCHCLSFETAWLCALILEMGVAETPEPNYESRLHFGHEVSKILS